jgi:hypothetical protein
MHRNYLLPITSTNSFPKFHSDQKDRFRVVRSGERVPLESKKKLHLDKRIQNNFNELNIVQEKGINYKSFKKGNIAQKTNKFHYENLPLPLITKNKQQIDEVLIKDLHANLLEVKMASSSLELTTGLTSNTHKKEQLEENFEPSVRISQKECEKYADKVQTGKFKTCTSSIYLKRMEKYIEKHPELMTDYGLHVAELSLITQYSTEKAYQSWNSYLRGGKKALKGRILNTFYANVKAQNVDNRLDIVAKEIEQHLKILISGMDKCSSFYGQKLYRGIRASGQLLEMYEKAQIGQIIRPDKAFMSTSKTRTAFKDTAFSKMNIQLVIEPVKGGKGKDISEISQHANESEVLYMPETEFEVVSKKRIGSSSWIIHLRERSSSESLVSDVTSLNDKD